MPALGPVAGSTAISDAVRSPWLPTGAIAQTYERRYGTGNLALTSGTMYLAAGLVLPANRAVSTITVVTGTQALATGTHQWFALYSKALALLGVTADDTSTAWAASSPKTLTLASPYTPTVDTEVYVGVLVTATTMPFLVRDGGSGTPATLAPVMGGTSSTGLTTPATAPATAAALSGSAYSIYAYVS